MSKFDEQIEEMLEKYTEWLNIHAEANNEDFRVSREMYDELGEEGSPRVLFDNRCMEGLMFEDRVIRITADPFHDEGGPAFLTAWFSWVKFVHFYGWEMTHMVQEFDTYKNFIVADGKFTSLPEEMRDA